MSFNKSFSTPIPKTFYHVTTKANLNSIQKTGLTPAIGDRSADLGEDTNRIYLFDSKESVNDALGNWLGEEFDEDEELILISVNASNIDSPTPTFDDPEGSFEWITENAILASSIKIEEDNLN